MPNQPKTPVHRFRLDDNLWERFGHAVSRVDPELDRSKVLRQLIAFWVREPGAKMPPRPPAAWS